MHADDLVPGVHLLQRHNSLQPALHRQLYDVTIALGRLRARLEHGLLQGRQLVLNDFFCYLPRLSEQYNYRLRT